MPNLRYLLQEGLLCEVRLLPGGHEELHQLLLHLYEAVRGRGGPGLVLLQQRCGPRRLLGSRTEESLRLAPGPGGHCEPAVVIQYLYSRVKYWRVRCWARYCRTLSATTLAVTSLQATLTAGLVSEESRRERPASLSL